MSHGATRNLFKRIEAAHDLMVGVVLSNLPSGIEENDRAEREVVMAAPLTASIEERANV